MGGGGGSTVWAVLAHLQSRAHVLACTMAHSSGIGGDVFDKGDWYHEVLEDGLAISYRVRPDRRLPVTRR